MAKASIHTAFVAATEYVRDRMGVANIGSFSLTINASGRTMTDRSEVKIEYRLSDSTWSGDAVKGNSLEAVTTEMLRRHGWNETHAPLALPPIPSSVKELNDALDEDY